MFSKIFLGYSKVQINMDLEHLKSEDFDHD